MKRAKRRGLQHNASVVLGNIYERDNIFSWDLLAVARRPDSLAGAGHLMLVTEPKKAAAAIVSFLRCMRTACGFQQSSGRLSRA